MTSHRSQYFSNGSLSHSTFKYWTNCCIVLPFRWKKRKIGNLVTVVDPLQCSNVFLGASQVASWEHPESPVLCVIVCHHDKPPTGSIGICKVLNSLGFSKSRVIAIIKGFQVRRKKYKKNAKRLVDERCINRLQGGPSILYFTEDGRMHFLRSSDGQNCSI